MCILCFFIWFVCLWFILVCLYSVYSCLVYFGWFLCLFVFYKLVIGFDLPCISWRGLGGHIVILDVFCVFGRLECSKHPGSRYKYKGRIWYIINSRIRKI